MNTEVSWQVMMFPAAEPVSMASCYDSCGEYPNLEKAETARAAQQNLEDINSAEPPLVFKVVRVTHEIL